MDPEGEAVNVRFQAPGDLARYIVEKGFIAVDGISLTVTESRPDGFSVTLIPYTQRHTNFQALRPGARVNLEIDILAKYVERLIEARWQAPALPGRA
jgi:riboflavin synthase